MRGIFILENVLKHPRIVAELGTDVARELEYRGEPETAKYLLSDVCGGGYHPFPAQAAASDEPFRLLAVAYCAAHSNDEAQLHITT